MINYSKLINQSDSAIDASNVSYYVYFAKTKKLKKVQKITFSKIEGPVITNDKNKKVRIVGSISRKRVKEELSGFLAQGFPNILAGARTQIRTCSTAVSILNKICDLKDKCNGKWRNIIICIVKLLLEIDTLMRKNFDFATFCQVILSIYNLHEEFFVAQAWDTLVLAGVATLLPQGIVKILRNAQLLSNTKIGDDVSCLNRLVVAIFDLAKFFVEKLPEKFHIKETFEKFLKMCSSSLVHIWISTAESYIKITTEDPSKLLSDSLRKQITSHDEKLSNEPSIEEWSRRSAGLTSILKKWKNLMRTIHSYNESGRQEPNCFIFEGAPGTMKSTVMNSLLEASGCTCYSHIVKSAFDSKDWYDAYNGEEIFFMDDIGQQGISQWRTIINMISAVKLPLDCADASLKDTKFFTSETLFITTNSFQTLHGLTKQDCISNLEALWRRGFIFDFNSVVSEGDFITGTIFFKFYDIKSNQFVNAFPVSFSQMYPHFAASFPVKPTNRHDLIAWMLAIVKGMKNVKKKFAITNKLSPEDVKLIQSKCESLLEPEFTANGLPSVSVNWNANSGILRMFDLMDDDVDAANYEQRMREEEEAGSWLKWLGSVWVFQVIGSLMREVVEYMFSTDGLKYLVGASIILALYLVCMTYFGKTDKEAFTGTQIHAVWDDNNPEARYYSFDKVKGVYTHALIDGEWVSIEEILDEPEPEKNFVGQGWKENFKFPDSSVSSSVVAIQRAVRDIDIMYNGQKLEGFGLVSGRHVIVPSHFVMASSGFINIYKSREQKHIEVNNEKYSVEWVSKEEDVAILGLPSAFPSPYPNLCHFFKNSDPTGVNHLVNAAGCWTIDNKSKLQLSKHCPYTYKLGPYNFVNSLSPKDFIYEIQGLGMCGSLVVNSTAGVLGMHVAGRVSDNTGVAIKWSNTTKSIIHQTLLKDKNILPWTTSDKILHNTSVVKIDRKMDCSVPTQTNFGPSPLFGIYPVTRSPANLQVFGKCTVKDVAKKSFKVVESACEDELSFGREVVASIIEPFDELTEIEVVSGNEYLAPLNKDSSNGYKCDKEKSVYIDFPNKVLTERCRRELDEIEKQILEQNVNWDVFVWTETLKDELRNDEKEGVPRSFRVGTIHQQILMKKYFGNFVGNLIKTRNFHQIMIGVNPFKEWPKIYNELLNCLGVFAGDIKNWDGNMIPQVQRIVAEEIVQKFKGDKTIPTVLIETLVHSLVAIQDDFYLTTHSMPSGSFLTAIFNSVVNKFYTAMWYYRECVAHGIRPTVKSFWDDVVDFVYGDDKLNGIRRHSSFLNAITMRNFFESLGLGFTTSTKGVICKEFEDIDDVTFLKRSFRYHDILQREVCPLDLRTLYSGLSYIDATKDRDIVMEGKLATFQREIYLHPDREALKEDFLFRMTKFKHQSFKILSDQYLYSIYMDDDIELDNFPKYVNL